jgi:hypothetical protein
MFPLLSFFFLLESWPLATRRAREQGERGEWKRGGGKNRSWLVAFPPKNLRISSDFFLAKENLLRAFFLHQKERKKRAESARLEGLAVGLCVAPHRSPFYLYWVVVPFFFVGLTPLQVFWVSAPLFCSSLRSRVSERALISSEIGRQNGSAAR